LLVLKTEGIKKFAQDLLELSHVNYARSTKQEVIVDATPNTSPQRAGNSVVISEN